jgi:hypothetical protein
VISRIRAWVGDPEFPAILIADVYQSRLTPEQLVDNDQYVGAQLAIAQADSNVLVINARRLTEDLGWNPTSGQADQFLEDGVHYTPLGARVLAGAVVAALMGEIHTNGCPSDPGTVTLQSSMTLVVDLGGTWACTNYGQLRVARSLNLKRPALKVALANGFVPAAGDKFEILSFASSSGSFGAVTLPTLPQSLSWNTSALYTEGTISVEGPAQPPPPPPLADPPTISVTSGANQSVTLPAAASPVAFAISGSGFLTVSGSSSNQTLLPNSGISVSSGCGQTTLSCTATLATAAEQTGTTTVSLNVTDTNGQSGSTTVTLQVVPASNPPPPPLEPPTGSASEGGRSGGGSIDGLSLIAFAIVLIVALTLRPTFRGRCGNSHM